MYKKDRSQAAGKTRQQKTLADRNFHVNISFLYCIDKFLFSAHLYLNLKNFEQSGDKLFTYRYYIHMYKYCQTQ